MSQERSFEGAYVVVTGRMTIGTREEIHQYIEDSGGTAQSSVTQKTSLVIYGQKAGSKLEKAREAGIETLSEAEFYESYGFEEAPGDDIDLEDVYVVVTGKMTIGTREEINQFIEDCGGTAQTSVTKKTQLLVYGERAGSKLEKAREAGIETVSEAEFYRRTGFS